MVERQIQEFLDMTSMSMHEVTIPTHFAPGLVALSIFVAALAGYIALDLVQRSAGAGPRARRTLIGAGGATMGLGIWSMHFIGMFSLEMEMPASYEPGLVALSLLAAIAGSGVALGLVARARAGLLDLITAASFMALAIAAMHYLGMASMQMEATISWSLPLVALSVVIGFAASLFALWLVMKIQHERLHLGARVRLAAAVILGFGVAGLHYCGMLAASFHPTRVAAEAAGGSTIGSGWIIVLLVAGAALMLAVLIVGAAVDQRRADLATELFHAAALVRDLGHMEGARGRSCAAVTEVTGADFAALLERDEDGRPAITATAGDPLGQATDDDSPAAVRDLTPLTADPVLAELAEKPGRDFSTDLAGRPVAQLGVDAVLGKTLVRDGRPAGVLVLTWRDRRRDLDDRTNSLLEMLVSEAAIAIDREDLIARLDYMARRDALTGLANRRTLQHELERAIGRAKAGGEPLSLVMLDLDKFKEHNDLHGHQAGDRLLKTAAGAWAQLLGEKDTLARYGGDEFIAILPGARLPEALQLAERLRTAVGSGVTASVGVAEWDGSQSGSRLIFTADAALYDAKRAGRDQSLGLPGRLDP
jgi:diguanylate cyclase (GGDEF)-like protein